jgi:hypothetical protein
MIGNQPVCLSFHIITRTPGWLPIISLINIFYLSQKKKKSFKGKKSSRIWNLVPHAIMWNIWRERNGRTFEDKDQSVGKVIELFMGDLYDWSVAWAFSSSHSLGVFLESLSLSSPS